MSSRGIVVLLALCGVLAGAAQAGNVATPPAHLARWQGTWNLGDTLLREGVGRPGALKPEAAQLLGRIVADQVELETRRWCRPPGFSGETGGRLDNVEIFVATDHLTLVTELGLVRRIFLDGRPAPADWPDTREGFSAGRLESDGTLVVETTHLSPDVSYGLFGAGVLTLGHGARITERIRFVDDRLHVEVTLVAPDVLTAPDRRSYVLQRAPAGYRPRQWDTCWAADRAIDPQTGKQRFDLTPPPDLPPPPP